jgi:excisionase family DNA binding protein
LHKPITLTNVPAMPTPTGADVKALYDYQEARAYAGCSLRTIKEAKLTGDLAHVSFGERRVRFRREDLDDWIARRRVPSRHETTRRAS